MSIFGIRFETFVENRGSGKESNQRRVWLVYRENGEYTLQISLEGIHIFNSDGDCIICE